MFKKIADWLIQRRNKQRHIAVPVDGTSPEDEFRRVINTLRENKVMVEIMEDGIYIRMAGNENKGECFSLEWAKAKSFNKTKDLSIADVSGASKRHQDISSIHRAFNDYFRR